MRRWILSGAVAVLALALTSVAFAKLTQVSKVTLTATHAGQSTGLKARTETADTTTVKPWAVTRIVIGFPSGTRINLNTTALKRCTTTDKKLADQFGPGCPRGSLIASGRVMLASYPLPSGLTKTPYNIPASVKAYLGRGNVVLVVQPTVDAYKSMITVLHATASGATLTVKVPKIMWGADKKTHFSGVRIALSTIQLDVPAIGSGTSALITAGRCTAHKFVVHTRFAFANGRALSATSSTRCR